MLAATSLQQQTRRLKMAVPDGGYDCEFVEEPTSAFQVECPVCLLKLHDPYIVSCCGKSFCENCIKLVQSEGSQCPACTLPFTIFPNKGLKQSLGQLHVYCTHRSDGCTWTGELGQLDRHLNEKFGLDGEGFGCPFAKIQCIHCNKQFQRQCLQDHPFNDCPKRRVTCKYCDLVHELGELKRHQNLNPDAENRHLGCEHVEIECKHQCGEYLKRRLIVEHENEYCSKRPFDCDHCKQYRSTFEDVSTNHWPECKCFPVVCPNVCAFSVIERLDLERHISEECPLTMVDCDYRSAGCSVQMPRKDMAAHLDEYVGAHLDLICLSKQILQKDALIKKLKILLGLIVVAFIILSFAVLFYVGISVTKTAVVTLVSIGTVVYAIKQIFTADARSLIPYTVSVCNFEKLRNSCTTWYSPPFYTHPQGYRMCLRVDANGVGDGEGTNVSVSVCLMQGEFDYRLNWPLRGDITVRLLDQEGEEEHQTMVISFTGETPDDAAGRVTTGERNEGWGMQRFIPHYKLSPKYLKNDRLRFQALEFELTS